MICEYEEGVTYQLILIKSSSRATSMWKRSSRTEMLVEWPSTHWQLTSGLAFFYLVQHVSNLPIHWLSVSIPYISHIPYIPYTSSIPYIPSILYILSVYIYTIPCYPLRIWLPMSLPLPLPLPLPPPLIDANANAVPLSLFPSSTVAILRTGTCG